MPKVNSSAKAHTSTIPDQEIDVPSSHEESAGSDQELENEGHSFQADHKHPIQECKYVHALYTGTKNGLDS